MDDAHVQWCENLFAMMADGGVWGIPRDGLVFHKQGDTLVLTMRMPWMHGMPGSASEWVAYQDAEFLEVKSHFEAAGVKVVSRLSE